MKIGLDVDGVLYRWGKAARAVMSECFGVEISEDEWFGEHHCTPDQWTWMWSDEGVARVFYEGRVFPGAVAFVRRLQDLGEVHLITAIPPNAEAARARWLRRRGLGSLPLHVVNPPTVNDGRNPAVKSEVRPQCDVYIDDNPANCVELAQNTTARLVILVDHTWNRGKEWEELIKPYPQITRGRNFTHILDLVDTLVRSGS